MKLVFAVDSIFPPLTGIGRYAIELANRLPCVEGVDDVRYLAMFRWLNKSQFSNDQQDYFDELSTPSLLPTLRTWAASKELMVKGYDVLSEPWRAMLLKSAAGAVYHSPNYFLAAYDGPSVATVHDLSILKFPETHPAARRRYFELAFERSLTRADMLITDTEAVRNELLTEFGLPPNKVRAIHLGVSKAFRPMQQTETNAVLQRYGLLHGGYCLSVATLEPRKKLSQLINSYSLMPIKLRKAWPLVLVGSMGWLNSHLRYVIERAVSEQWLHFLGYVPQADLPSIYAGARGYAMSSIYEGFGLPLVEAMASGIPVLTSKTSCMPEVTGGAAILANPDDSDGLCSQLEKLLTDDVWRKKAAAIGIDRAALMSWESCLQKTVAVYREISGGHGNIK